MKRSITLCRRDDSIASRSTTSAANADGAPFCHGFESRPVSVSTPVAQPGRAEAMRAIPSCRRRRSTVPAANAGGSTRVSAARPRDRVRAPGTRSSGPVASQHLPFHLSPFPFNDGPKSLYEMLGHEDISLRQKITMPRMDSIGNCRAVALRRAESELPRLASHCRWARMHVALRTHRCHGRRRCRRNAPDHDHCTVASHAGCSELPARQADFAADIASVCAQEQERMALLVRCDLRRDQARRNMAASSAPRDRFHSSRQWRLLDRSRQQRSTIVVLVVRLPEPRTFMRQMPVELHGSPHGLGSSPTARMADALRRREFHTFLSPHLQQ